MILKLRPNHSFRDRAYAALRGLASAQRSAHALRPETSSEKLRRTAPSRQRLRLSTQVFGEDLQGTELNRGLAQLHCLYLLSSLSDADRVQPLSLSLTLSDQMRPFRDSSLSRGFDLPFNSGHFET